jgi:hypothetical protein
MTVRWRAHVLRDSYDFQVDRVRILLAEDGADGRRTVLPVKVETGEPADPIVSEGPPPEAFLTLPAEAGEALFSALAEYFIGTSDIVRLSRDLAAERKRVDALIAGIGRTGGVIIP